MDIQKNSEAQPAQLDQNEAVLAPELGNYLNYRLFLNDFYLYRKKISKNDLRPYNYQFFSAAANIKSPNYLKMIIEGRRNLSEDMIGKFGRALSLSKDQTEEFRILVRMNQSEDTSERNIFLKTLSEFRVEQKLKSGQIDRRAWEKIPNWTAWVILAVVDQPSAQVRMSDLRAILRDKASEDEIEKAVSGLLGSGQLSRDSRGLLRRGRAHSETPEDVPVALVRKLQAQLMYLGLESLYHDAPTEREFGTLTLNLTKDEFAEIKFKLRQMRKAIHKDTSIARMKTAGERVYQLNIQLFPVTDKITAVNADAQNEAQAEVTDTRSVESLLQAASDAARIFIDHTQ
ncbi:MAG: DUF4423 domain-containing protein [Bdellovibrionales bacterium]|nr:DUF4423 domain-containing protein [Bdellovibrionales bacterium]